jgi:small subunit ribosomal protein S3Ae|tara:strand:- start:350 stop:1228 length:879 start_codon:yes stop_codon:yes gene_type:complete
MAKGASARAAARKQRDKWKSKRWYTIRAPRTPWSFRVIGETLAEEPEQLIGRHYEVIQNELDGDFSKMHVKVVFRVTDVLGNDAITEFVGHELLKDHVRRQVRRDRGKIDDTIDVITEDGYYVRFKPLMISRGRIKSSQKQQMRTLAREVILKTGATSTWYKLQASTLDGTLETMIKEAVSKIQPVRTVVIRRTQLLQAGVIVEDGPTLDEVHAQEKEENDAAKSSSEDITDESIEDVESDDVSESDAESASDESEDIDYSSMTVPQLKELLKEAGKPVSGKKADLIDRLNE